MCFFLMDGEGKGGAYIQDQGFIWTRRHFLYIRQLHVDATINANSWFSCDVTKN